MSWSRGLCSFVCGASLVGGAAATCTSFAEAPELEIDLDDSDLSPVVAMLPGMVEPEQLVNMSVPLDGVLGELAVREGDFVIKGQLLAKMDTRVAEEAVRVAEASANQQASIEAAETEHRAAQSYLNRVRYASELQAASELEIDQAHDRVEVTKAGVAQAKNQQQVALTQLALEQARLRAHSILAPFTGRVIRIDAKAGQTMTRSEPLLTLVNMQTLRADLHVPIRWFRKLKVGETFELMAYEPVDAKIPARLLSCEPLIDAATKTFRCVFVIDNSSEDLPAGFSVRLVDPNVRTEPLVTSNRPPWESEL